MEFSLLAQFSLFHLAHSFLRCHSASLSVFLALTHFYHHISAGILYCYFYYCFALVFQKLSLSIKRLHSLLYKKIKYVYMLVVGRLYNNVLYNVLLALSLFSPWKWNCCCFYVNKAIPTKCYMRCKIPFWKISIKILDVQQYSFRHICKYFFVFVWV